MAVQQHTSPAAMHLEVVEHGFVDEFLFSKLRNGVVVQFNVARDDVSLVTQCAHLVVVHRRPKAEHHQFIIIVSKLSSNHVR